MDGTAIGKVATADSRLPERQRDALALLEQEGLSYGEIAARLGTSRDSVAQLIAHARINLYDELHGSILASVAPSRECERALSLIAAREDGELDLGSADAAWLDSHLDDCERCGRGVEEMGEVHAAYRAGMPIPTASADTPPTDSSPAPLHPPRRRSVLVAGLAALLLLAGVAAAFVREDRPATSVDRAAGAAGSGAAKQGDAQTVGSLETKSRKVGTAGKKTRAKEEPADATSGEAPVGGTTTAAAATPVAAATNDDATSEPASRPSRPSGKTAVEPTQRTSAPKPRPAPTPTASAEPPPAPSTAEPPPVEEPADERPRGREPPGRPDDRPPHRET